MVAVRFSSSSATNSANRALRASCRVIVNYAHGREAAEKVAAEIGGEARGCDIADERSVEAMFDAVGQVDVLVNNARIDPYKRSAGMSDGD